MALLADGITRNSLLALAREIGFTIEERQISIHEIEKTFRNNTLIEAFGAGTAAVVAPIQTISIDGLDFNLPAYTDNSIMYKLKQKLELIRSGQEPDLFGWNFIL